MLARQRRLEGTWIGANFPSKDEVTLRTFLAQGL